MLSGDRKEGQESRAFNPAEIGALAHLYRGEVYRSTVWRTRLDATTNWAVVSTGLALSLTFSSESASPLPLVLVGLLVAVFLTIEARRYGCVSTRASKYGRCTRTCGGVDSGCLQDGQHGHGPAEKGQSAAEGGGVLVAVGARAEVVAEFVVPSTEPGR